MLPLDVNNSARYTVDIALVLCCILGSVAAAVVGTVFLIYCDCCLPLDSLWLRNSCDMVRDSYRCRCDDYLQRHIRACGSNSNLRIS